MKEMNKSKIIDKHSERLVLSERTLLAKIKHPFIVNMHYAFQDNYTLYLILDFMQGGDLRYHLCHKKCFNENQTKFIIANIILGLEYLHYNRTIHRDIKPENIVMDEKGYVKITDFGVAKLLEPPLNSFSHDSNGTPGYMAPEALCGLNQSYVADYFALGVLCYELLTGIRPYIGKSRKEIKEKIMSFQAKLFDYNKDFSLEVVDFINKLIKRKPGQRLGIKGDDEVKKHSWFLDFDWKKLYLKKTIANYIPENIDNYDAKYCNEDETVGYDTLRRYEEIKSNISIYNVNVFSNYLDYNPKKRDRSTLYKEKDLEKEGGIIFVNPHLIYEEYIDDNVIVSNIIAPTLASSRNLDKKYLSFRKKSAEMFIATCTSCFKLKNTCVKWDTERKINRYRSKFGFKNNSSNVNSENCVSNNSKYGRNKLSFVWKEDVTRNTMPTKTLFNNNNNTNLNNNGCSLWLNLPSKTFRKFN